MLSRGYPYLLQAVNKIMYWSMAINMTIPSSKFYLMAFWQPGCNVGTTAGMQTLCNTFPHPQQTSNLPCSVSCPCPGCAERLGYAVLKESATPGSRRTWAPSGRLCRAGRAQGVATR